MSKPNKEEEKKETWQHEVGEGVLVLLFLGAAAFVLTFCFVAATVLATKMFAV